MCSFPEIVSLCFCSLFSLFLSVFFTRFCRSPAGRREHVAARLPSESQFQNLKPQKPTGGTPSNWFSSTTTTLRIQSQAPVRDGTFSRASRRFWARRCPKALSLFARSTEASSRTSLRTGSARRVSEKQTEAEQSRMDAVLRRSTVGFR